MFAELPPQRETLLESALHGACVRLGGPGGILRGYPGVCQRPPLEGSGLGADTFMISIVHTVAASDGIRCFECPKGCAVELQLHVMSSSKFRVAPEGT